MPQPPAARKAGNFLTGKIGPLPAWMWGAAAGGGFLWWYLRRQRKQQAAADDAAAAALAASTVPRSPGASPLLVSTGGEYLYNYSGSVSTTTTGGDPPPPTPAGTPVRVWSYDASQQGPIGSLQPGANVKLAQGTPAPGFWRNEPGYLIQWPGGPGGMGWIVGEDATGPNPDGTVTVRSGSSVDDIVTGTGYGAGGGMLRTIGGGGGAGMGAHRMGTMPRPSWVGSGAGYNLRHQSMARARRPERIG